MNGVKGVIRRREGERRWEGEGVGGTDIKEGEGVGGTDIKMGEKERIRRTRKAKYEGRGKGEPKGGREVMGRGESRGEETGRPIPRKTGVRKDVPSAAENPDGAPALTPDLYKAFSRVGYPLRWRSDLYLTFKKNVYMMMRQVKSNQLYY